jgi:isopenicillin-N epimerase
VASPTFSNPRHLLLGAVDDDTRVVAATLVHSSTGLKLPVREIAARFEGVNTGRDPSERALLCLDGVHGFGVEDVDIGTLGCDVFFAGTHKWIFAPRGTGIGWAGPAGRDQVRPTIPTFTRDGTWGGTMTPGGFKPFEHQWSMAEGFAFHEEVGGRQVVADRIRTLATRLKEGLSEIPGVTLRTPMDPELSAGIVCFDVGGLSPDTVVSPDHGGFVVDFENHTRDGTRGRSWIYGPTSGSLRGTRTQRGASQTWRPKSC